MHIHTNDGLLLNGQVMYVNMSVGDLPPGLLPPAQFTIITCFLTFCGIVGVVLNSVTFLVFVSVPSLRCPTNLFIMAVLLCDVAMSTLGIPFEAVASVHNRWIFGQAGCSWYGFIMSFLGYTSIYLLTAISVERYLLITNPFSRPLITKTRAIGVIVACATLALLLSIFPLIGWNSYQLEAALISCSVNWQSNSAVDVSYIVTIFLLGFFVPITVMASSYCKVFLMVHALARNQLWGENSHVTRRNIKMEYRTTRNILLVICAFLLCWTPYAAVSLWSAFGNPEDISPLAGTVPSLIAKSSVVWNPLIYVLTNQQFRSRFISLFTCHVRSQTRSEELERQDEEMEMKRLTIGLKEECNSQNYKSVQMYKGCLKRNCSLYLHGNDLGHSYSSSLGTLTIDKSDVASV